MSFTLPTLPYELNDLAPYMSKQAIDLHYNKHTKKYYDTVNELISGTIYQKEKSIIDLINNSSLSVESKLFKQACQAWNHTFFWDSLRPKKDFTSPSGELEKAIINSFDSFENFKEEFSRIAVDFFGSGWIWLILTDGKLMIGSSINHITPITGAALPILNLDVWEHSYYVDYPADRKKYVENWWNIINWDIINERFQAA